MAVAPSRPPISFARDASSLTFDELLGEARESFVAELAIPMTVSRPPILSSIDERGERVYAVAPGARVGLSMSSQLHRRIGHPEGYGNVFPVARALYDLEGWCRGRHLKSASGPWVDHLPDLAIPDLQRPLCARLAWYTVAWSTGIVWAADQESLTLMRAEQLLTSALRHMWEQRREWAHGDESGVSEVLAAQRRERAEARRAAEASRQRSLTCRYCRRPYDPESNEPCPGDPDDQLSEGEAAYYAEMGLTLLCSPGDPA